MGAVSTNPYSSQSIAGYNASPPADDGSEVSSNKLEWSKHRTKLADPIKTLTESVNTAVSAAHAKGVNTDTGVRNQMSGSFALEYATATIDTDAITPDASSVLVGSEGGATSDTLQTINTTSVYDGALLYLRQRNASEEIVVVHATSTAGTATGPNIYLAGKEDYTLAGATDSLTLQYEGNTASGWVEQSRAETRGVVQPPLTTQDGAVATGTTTSVLTSIPQQSTHGDLYLTAPAFTPKSASNILLIRGLVFVSSSVSNRGILALHQDSTEAALATGQVRMETATEMYAIPFEHRMLAGTTSPTTFKVHVGGSTAGTTTFNGQAGAVHEGGTLASFITVTEYAA